MDKSELSKLTDKELLVLKKKLKNSKIFHATFIGFLAGILVVGVVGWSVAKNPLGLIPMLLLAFLIYRIVKNSKKNKALEDILKERNLD
ncbi:hypothetical protein [Aquimarina litoralis]|uniref:hypothetical protein n=1 Tax=Aquimarina litoralis TaxID=584605 RepID=UPI001C5A556C|nr:hypothetical protein [Aquimarina litoralis]MBW1294387.1 hypothetical protein [Aquimarina litoralis]